MHISGTFRVRCAKYQDRLFHHHLRAQTLCTVNQLPHVRSITHECFCVITFNIAQAQTYVHPRLHGAQWLHYDRGNKWTPQRLAFCIPVLWKCMITSVFLFLSILYPWHDHWAYVGTQFYMTLCKTAYILIHLHKVPVYPVRQSWPVAHHFSTGRPNIVIFTAILRLYVSSSRRNILSEFLHRETSLFKDIYYFFQFTYCSYIEEH